MQVREIELTHSTITNGRLYFPTTDAKFFPADSFGDRNKDGHKGVPVIFIAGPFSFTDYIRVSSGQRFSPRSDFTKYLRHIEALPGDKLRVTRSAERQYQLEHLPSQTS